MMLTLMQKHKEWCKKDKQILLTMSPNSNPHCLDYFQFNADKTTKDSCIAILHIVAPEAKALSKSKDVQCQLVLQQVVPALCKELFDNKESCLWVELVSLNHDAGGEQHGGEMEGMDKMIIETIDNQI